MAIFNITLSNVAGLGEICHRSVYDSSGGACPLRQSDSARTEILFLPEEVFHNTLFDPSEAYIQPPSCESVVVRIKCTG
jgi:hypothetical protein